MTSNPSPKYRKVPLSRTLRPARLEDFVGQSHLIGPTSPLFRALDRGVLPPLILYGPPGCGKTALAHLLAARLGADLRVLSGTGAGVAEIRSQIPARCDSAKSAGGTLFDEASARPPVFLFVDEIHRLAKNQQEVLLPALEEGGFYFAAATTENPNFVLAKGLVSRSMLLRFEPLAEEHLSVLLDRGISRLSKESGVSIRMPPEVRKEFLRAAAGDGRRLLSALELLSLEHGPTVSVTNDMLEKLPGLAVRYDRAGDDHYDVISAFIKSMRGGDPDATLYWMARMIAGGEDPRFIARRIVICAAEDVGLASPQALVVAQAAFASVEQIGMPEGRIPLALAALTVARSPKSNSAYEGVNAAVAAVEKGLMLEVPQHLRGDPYTAAGYVYPHTHPEDTKKQKYLPKPHVFFHPKPQDG